MPNVQLPTPEQGDSQEETIENLVQVLAKYRRELEFLLHHLDQDNVRANTIQAKSVSSDWVYTGGLTAEQVIVGEGTQFESGYDPTTKLDSSSVGDMAFEDMVEEAKLGSTIIDGGYIKSSLLTADNIVTGTLTGLLIRTSSSGKRVEMRDDNKLRFYDSNGSWIGTIDAYSGSGVPHGASLEIRSDASMEIYNYGDGNVSSINLSESRVNIGGTLRVSDTDVMGPMNFYDESSVSGLYTAPDSHNHSASSGNTTVASHNHGLGGSGYTHIRVKNPDTGDEKWEAFSPYGGDSHDHSVSVNNDSHDHSVQVGLG